MSVCTSRDGEPVGARVTEASFEVPVDRLRAIWPTSHVRRTMSLGHSGTILERGDEEVIGLGSGKRKIYVMFAFILAAVCSVIVKRLVPVPCRCVVEIVATAIGVVFALRARRLERIILPMRDNRSAFDSKPTRAARHAMAASLRVALSQTELRSLFPTVPDRANHIVTMIDR